MLSMMTPIYLNPTTTSPFPFMELQEECDHHSLHLFLAPPHNNSINNQSSSSSMCSTLFTKTPDDQFSRRNPSTSDDPFDQNDRNKVYEYSTQGELSDHNSNHQVDNDHRYYNKVSSAKPQDEEVVENVRINGNGSMKWMCSKVRLMRKMIQKSDHQRAPSWIELKNHHHHQDQDQNQNLPPESSEMVVENNNNGDGDIIIRVCSNCNTTKTPLWRSGPQGPKSLCNACGIRQRKARRAMEAAAAAAGCATIDAGGEGSSSSTISVKSTLKLVTKKKKPRSSSHYNLAEHNKIKHHKHQHFDQVTTKESSFVDECNEKNNNVWFEEFAKNLLRKNSSFRRMFTEDEEEGAVLLMALSYGHGLLQT